MARDEDGGRRIAGRVSQDSEERLARHGLFDVMQLLSVAAVPDARPHLATALGIDEAGLAAMERTLTEGLPPRERLWLAAAPPLSKPAGALLPTAELRSRIARDAPVARRDGPGAHAPDPLPPAVNHANGLLSIRSQGARGTCVACAITAMNEHYRWIVDNETVRLSEQFLYFNCKREDDRPDDCGTWVTVGTAVLTKVGQCANQFWPYNPNLPCNNHGAPASDLAGLTAFRNSVETFVLDPNDVTELKRALAGGSCVAFAIPVFSSWRDSVDTELTGRIAMPLQGEGSDGGHAMCLIGYQDDGASPGGGYFVLRNSWGTDWGRQSPYGTGNGTIPYAFLESHGTEAVTVPKPVRHNPPPVFVPAGPSPAPPLHPQM